METDKFYKLAPQALKNSDLNIISKKMEDSYDSDSDSHSESDTNVKQAIWRSEAREKPAHKNRAVYKYFGVRNPRIDPKICDWLWESPYHCQEYKDELREGTHSSNINSSKDEWFIGKHELNTFGQHYQRAN